MLVPRIARIRDTLCSPTAPPRPRMNYAWARNWTGGGHGAGTACEGRGRSTIARGAGNAAAHGRCWRSRWPCRSDQIAVAGQCAPAMRADACRRRRARASARRAPIARSRCAPTPRVRCSMACSRSRRRSWTQDKVDAITDWSFNDQKPFPCVCFETGEKWHYVWTRDLSLRGRPGAGAARPGTHARRRCGSSCPTYARSAAPHRALYRRAGHRLRRQLADQQRPRGVVPRGAPPAGRRTGLRRRGLAARSTTRWRRIATLRLRRRHGPVSRRDLVPRLARTDLPARGPRRTSTLHRAVLRAVDQRAALRGAAPGRAAWRASAATHARPRTRSQADALRTAIDRAFWREDARPVHELHRPGCAPGAVRELRPARALSLAILAGVAPPERARTRARRNYPVVEVGSPVIWPQQPATRDLPQPRDLAVRQRVLAARRARGRTTPRASRTRSAR